VLFASYYCKKKFLIHRPILPNEAEINTVDSFDGDPMTLADCDQFVLMMKTALGYDLRVKAIIFKNNYLAELEDISFRVDRFFTCFFFVEKNKQFHQWLEVVLAFGNYLNGTTNRGGAYGFKLDTLAKLSELKSNDNKKTLFYYIVEYIGDNNMEDLFEIIIYLEVFQGRKITS
jgi:hypothetical protein